MNQVGIYPDLNMTEGFNGLLQKGWDTPMYTTNKGSSMSLIPELRKITSSSNFRTDRFGNKSFMPMFHAARNDRIERIIQFFDENWNIPIVFFADKKNDNMAVRGYMIVRKKDVYLANVNGTITVVVNLPEDEHIHRLYDIDMEFMKMHVESIPSFEYCCTVNSLFVLDNNIANMSNVSVDFDVSNICLDENNRDCDLCGDNHAFPDVCEDPNK